MNTLLDASTEQLQHWDDSFHLHPFTDTKQLHEIGCRVINRADNIYIWDSNGHKMIDGMAGLWCVNVGYGREELVDAATKQIRQMPYYNTFFQTSHPAVIDLGLLLSGDITPDHIQYFFPTNSGSEANDTVIRLVRRYWMVQNKPQKSTIISRRNAYHGSTIGAASLGGMQEMHKDGVPIPGIEHIQQPYWYCEGGNLTPEEFGLRVARALEDKITELGVDNVAAFIAEPIQGAGGVIVPPSTYWPEISRICKKYDILLVVDEVICGFGRTGEWFGSQHFDIHPDLMVMAKGLSSGYIPIAGVMLSKYVGSILIEKCGEFAHGYTYSGHPVACAVAAENIRLMIREKIVETVKQKTGPYFQKRLSELNNHPLVGEVRGVGMIAGIQLVKDKLTRELHSPDLGIGVKCRNIAANLGLIMRAVGDSMVLSPPLVITEEQIDKLVQIVSDSLDRTYELKKT